MDKVKAREKKLAILKEEEMKRSNNNRHQNLVTNDVKMEMELKMLTSDPFRCKPYMKRQIAPQSPPITIKMS